MSRRKQERGLVTAVKWLSALVIVLLLIAAALPLLERLAPKEVRQDMTGAIPGIDVSAHQGPIDWQAVAGSGVRFAMVRLGYRSYEGVLNVDERAGENLAGARAAGLQVGAYFFSQATDPEEARQEAELAVQVLEGMALDLPLAYDWEYVSDDARTGDMDPDTLEQCVHSFCGAVEAAGYSPMVYFNQELSRTLLDLEAVEEYPFWLAMYAPELEFRCPVAMWQWSDQGKVDGIGGYTDLDWYLP